MADQVRSWARHDRHQPLDQLMRREPKCCRAIAPGPLEPQLETSILELRQPIGRDRRPGKVSPHALESVAIVGRDPGSGLKVVAFDLRAQPPHHESVNIGGDASNVGVIPYWRKALEHTGPIDAMIRRFIDADKPSTPP